MKPSFFVGMGMAIPPYGLLFSPLGVKIQLVGLTVQIIGFVIICYQGTRIICPSCQVKYKKDF